MAGKWTLAPVELLGCPVKGQEPGQVDAIGDMDSRDGSVPARIDGLLHLVVGGIIERRRDFQVRELPPHDIFLLEATGRKITLPENGRGDPINKIIGQLGLGQYLRGLIGRQCRGLSRKNGYDANQSDKGFAHDRL